MQRRAAARVLRDRTGWSATRSLRAREREGHHPRDDRDVAAWIRGARRRDRASIGRLYERFHPVARSYLGWCMGAFARRWASADDLTSEVLVEAIRGLRSLSRAPTEREFVARVCRVARSRVLDVARKHRRSHGESQVAEEPRRDPPSTGAVTRTDRRQYLAALVARLDPRQRDVIRLRLFEGKSYAEVGQALGLRPDTARKRYDAAIERLRALLGRRWI